MPPYEITKIVRASGFDPLAPPRREGTTYVVRATDFRGILMRVVVDARSGALRAVNRIVPGPAPYGVVGMMTSPYGPPGYGPPPYGPPPYGPAYGPPPYGPPPYGPPAYGEPADIGDPEMGPMEANLSVPPPPPAIYSGAHSLAPESPPLPRPRPAGLVSRETQPAAKPAEAPAAKPEAAPAAASAPPAAPPPAAAPAVAPQKKPLQSSPIPD